MKIGLSVLLLMVLCLCSSAQTVFAPQGAVWHYEFNFDGDGFIYRYEVEKDTFYKSKMCSKVTCQKNYKGSITILQPTFFFTNGDTVFYYHDSLKSFTPLYIFNVKKGDTITLAAPIFSSGWSNTFSVVVTKIDTTIIDGLPLRTIYTDNVGLHHFFIRKYTERFGGYGIANIIAIDRNKTAMHFEAIRCYRDNEIDEKFISDKWDCDVATSIEEKANPNEIHIFPNPSSNIININLNNSKVNGNLYLFSMEGKLLNQKKLITPNTQLDIKHLTKGIYLLQIKNEKETFSKLITVLN